MVDLTHGTSLSAAQTFVNRIKPYTNAAIQYCSVTQGVHLLENEEGSGETHNLGLAAHLFLRRQSDMKLYHFFLISPTLDIFEDGTDNDMVVKEDFGNTVAEWYSDLAEDVFLFDQGYLVGKAI